MTNKTDTGRCADLDPTADPTCGCCEGIEVQTPVDTANRPGLTALAYRVGTHPTFLTSMLARLSGLRLEHGLDPLASLTTRDDDDPSIALLDAWASVAHVLTFYQERLANEGYLRTATERRSLLELARLVGYRPRPGLAARVYLAFTLEQDAEVEIPAGTRAQSVPEDAGELPQFFEIEEAFAAHYAWNALKARRGVPHYFSVDQLAGNLFLSGVTTNLAVNDPIFIGKLVEGRQLYRVIKVTPNTTLDHTRVDLALWRASTPGVRALAAAPAAGVAERVGAAVRLHSGFVEFGVSPGAMTGRVLAQLDSLERRASGPEGAELLEAVEATLRELRREHATAFGQGFSNLEPWLQSMIAELESAVQPSALERSVDSRSVARSAGEPPELSAIVSQLSKPPSAQPVSPLQLQPKLDRTFGQHAALELQYATVFNPSVATSLYSTWAAAPVTDPAPVKEVEVLRVRAAPFGATAPLEPVTNKDTGVIENYKEWTLAERVALTIEIFHSGRSGSFELTRGGAAPSGADLKLDPVNSEASAEVEIDALAVAKAEARYVGADDRLDIISLGLALGPHLEIDLEIEVVSAERLDISLNGQPAVSVGEDPVPLGRETDEDTLGTASVGYEAIEIKLDSLPRRRVLALDAVYDAILPGSTVVIEPAHRPLIVTLVEAVETVAKAAYGLTGKVTQLLLKDTWLSSAERFPAIRKTSVYAAPESLELADRPLQTPVCGDSIELDGLYEGLEPGKWVIVGGERILGVECVAGKLVTTGDAASLSQIEGVDTAELAMIAGVRHLPHQHSVTTREGLVEVRDLAGDTNHTVIELAEPLAYVYRRETVSIYGNVVKASHGETREQVLGSGDGSQANQSFSLAFKPLTHLASATPEGSESTLEVHVNEVEWDEIEHGALLEADEPAFFTRTDNDDVTTVHFGDGPLGARLPTGVENVAAKYRQGIGKAGNVAAEQISILATQPLGAKSVVNPLPASGGADRDNAEAIRANAPLAVGALDRLVSVSDFAAFARTFAGIAKATAVRLSDGRRQLVHLTIAGVDDAPIAESSDLLVNLEAALRRFGDPNQPFEVAVRELKLLLIKAAVRVQREYRWKDVEPKIRAALLETFGFERRELGQDVVPSEVIAVIQGIRGVDWVDLDVLVGLTEADVSTGFSSLAEERTGSDVRPGRVQARLPTAATGPISAEIAYLSPDLPETLLLEEHTS